MAKEKKTAKDYFPEAKESWTKLLVSSVSLPTPDIAEIVWKSWKLDDENEMVDRAEISIPFQAPAAETPVRPKKISPLPNAIVELNEIDNIRALANPGMPITFASHITLFFGRNSSGKSTISQALKVFAFPSVEEAPPGFADEDNSKDKYDSARKAKIRVCSLDEFRRHPASTTLTTQECEWCSDQTNETKVSLVVIDRKLVEQKEAQTPWNSDFALGLDAFDRVRVALEILSGKLERRKNKLKNKCQSLLGSYTEGAFSSASSILKESGMKADDEGVLEQKEAKLQKKLTATKEARNNEKLLQDEVASLSRKATAVRLLRSDSGSPASVLALLAELTKLRQDQEVTLGDIIQRHNLSIKHQSEWAKFAESGDLFIEEEYDSSKHKYPQEGDHCIYCGQGLSGGVLAFLKEIREHLSNATKTRLKDVTSNLGKIQNALLDLQGNDGIPTLGEHEQLGSIHIRYEGEHLSKLELELSERVSEKQQLLDSLTSKEKHDEMIATIERDLTSVRKSLFAIRNKVTIENWKSHKEAFTSAEEIYSEVANQKRLWSNQRRIAADNLAIGAFQENFNAECNDLGLQFKMTVKAGTDSSSPIRKTVVRGKDPGDILSESERSVWVLADCLAELKTVNKKCVLILDDPVSSMDTERANLLAWRILTESDMRQVIVLTHNRHFYLALRKLISLKYKGAKERVRGYFVERWREHTGLISEVSLFKNEEELLKEKVQKIIDDPVADNFDVAGGFLMLRRLIEDFIDQELLKGFRTKLDPEKDKIEWDSLKSISINPAVVDELRRLHWRICDLGGLHLTATHSLAQPTKQDLEDISKEVLDVLERAKTGTVAITP